MNEQLEGMGEKLSCPDEALIIVMMTIIWSLLCARYFPKYFTGINLQSYLVGIVIPIYR